jgi:hypothetical protein
MARGWESKAIEEQISAREAESEESKKTAVSRADLERRTKRDGLLLARVRTLNALQAAKDERYRVMLQGALAHLDSEIAGLDLTP